MKPAAPCHSRRRGVTLVESVIAIGVLAVAIPMVFGALAESGRSAMASQAETRSAWIVPVCMDEIHASREGRPRYFTSTLAGQAFPAAGEVWAIAFSADGKPVGKIGKALYQSGVRELNGKAVRYVATLSATTESTRSGIPPMLRVDVSLEYPASAPTEKRAKIDFHTRIP